MGWKAFAEIDLPATTDAFTAGSKLKALHGIMGVSIVTVQQIRVKYDNRKLTADAITQAVIQSKGDHSSEYREDISTLSR